MGWTRGLQLDVCTLQAALATALGGETCHHVTGVNPFARFRGGDGSTEAYVATESMQVRHLLSRFLLIDEWFMNSS